MVWYNHSKLRALKAKAARQNGKCDEDLERPTTNNTLNRLQSRTKDDILGEIQRLQREMDVLGRRGPAASKLKASGNSSTILVMAGGGGGDSSGSSSPGGGVVRAEEHHRAAAALSGRHYRQ